MGVNTVIAELRSSRSYAEKRRQSALEAAARRRVDADREDAGAVEAARYIAEIDLALSTLEASHGE